MTHKNYAWETLEVAHNFVLVLGVSVDDAKVRRRRFSSILEYHGDL